MAIDVLLRNGTVLDGAGGEPFVADVAVAGDRIAWIERHGVDRDDDADRVDAALAAGVGEELDCRGLAGARVHQRDATGTTASPRSAPSTATILIGVTSSARAWLARYSFARR